MFLLGVNLERNFYLFSWFILWPKVEKGVS